MNGFALDLWTHYNSTTNKYSIKYHPPDPNFIKVNFDGSVSLQNAATGFVLRNDQGNVLGGGSFNVDGATISEAEAMALKEGLSFALKKGVSKI